MKTLPSLAIVGRPNVGKSTLFNRLLRSRVAITDPTPGVTRDPIEKICFLDDISFNLIDTGGWTLSKTDMDKEISKRSLAKVQEADCIMLVLDCTEITPEDLAFINILRPFNNKLLVVANKVDSFERESLVYNLYSLGLNDIIPVSAEHNYNVPTLRDLLKVKMITLGALKQAPLEEGEQESDEVKEAKNKTTRISILGKPNAGKSTLLNSLLGKEVSIVSPIAGTTRDTIEGTFNFSGRKFEVIDTAGIRRKSKVYDNIEYYSVNRAIKSIEDCDVVFLLIDIVEGLTEQDKKIAAQIIKHGKGVVIVANKIDLIEQHPNFENAYKDRIRDSFPVLGFAPIVLISAQKQEALKSLLRQAMKVQDQLRKTIETPDLNKYLKIWVDDNEPPKVGNKAYRPKYLTQVSIEPVKFVLFVNHANSFPEFYLRYIINNIRRLGFDSIPIEVEAK